MMAIRIAGAASGSVCLLGLEKGAGISLQERIGGGLLNLGQIFPPGHFHHGSGKTWKRNPCERNGERQHC